jgi:hypothetical protein
VKTKAVLLVVCAALTLWGQSNPPSAPDSETAKARHRLGLVATRAIAYFRSADSIEASLEEEGLSLNAGITALRSLLEAAMDEADAALAKDDLTSADKALGRAEALLGKFAARLGG